MLGKRSGQVFSVPKPRKAQQAGPAGKEVKQRGYTDRHKKSHHCFRYCLGRRSKKFEAMFSPYVKILCILSHSSIFSTWLHCFSTAWELVYLKVNGMLGWKERRGRKKRKKGKKNQGQILKSKSYSQTDFSLCLLSCFSQPPYWHRQI